MKEIMQRAIVDSFMKLCSTKPVREITIQDIVTDCGISKQTFYNHFSDKCALMNYVYQIEADHAYCAFTKKEGSIEKAMQYMLERCLENQKYYFAIAQYEVQNDFEHFFFLSTKEYYVSYIIERYGKKILTIPIQYAIDFSCSGSAHLFLGWIRNGMREAPKVMAAIIYNCMPVQLKELMA